MDNHGETGTRLLTLLILGTAFVLAAKLVEKMFGTEPGAAR